MTSSHELVCLEYITVVADLTRKNPTAPNPEETVVYDGTTAGNGENQLVSSLVTEKINEAPKFYDRGWQKGSWWPTFFFKILSPLDMTVLLYFTVDILTTVTFVSLKIVDWILYQVHGVDVLINIGDELFKELVNMPLLSSLFQIALGCWRVVDGLRVSGVGMTALIIAIAAATIATLSALTTAQAYAVILEEVFGEDYSWAAAYYAIVLVVYLKMILPFPDVVAKYQTYGARFIEFVVKWVGVEIGCDLNPITGTLTIASTALTLAFLIVMFWYYLNMAL